MPTDLPQRARSAARSTARAILRPVWLLVWRRIEARIRTMGPIAAAPANMSYEAAWQQHMPAFLNAVSTVGAFGHELARHRRETAAAMAELRERMEALCDHADEIAARIAPPGREALAQRTAELAARIEFIRREILYEMRNAATHAPPTPIPPTSIPPLADASPLQPRVLSAAKLAALQEGGLRVNLGCGHLPLDGYVNIDMRELPGVDIVAEAGNLPFEPASLAELRSAHLLEHFPQEALRRRLLPYWRSLLAPGGGFVAVVPDGEAMVSHLAAGNYPFEQFREVLFGAQDYAGDFHFNLFEPRSLHALLDEAGFADIDVPVKARRNGACYELEVRARKPHDPAC